MQNLLLLTVALAQPSSAGAEMPFPLDLVAAEPTIDALRYVPSDARIARLAGLEEVTLAAVMLPDGRMVDLELSRIHHDALGFRYYVDGVERFDLLDGSDLSVWTGHVRGAADSEAMLAFSNFGSQGWVELDGQLVHLTPRANARGDWRHGDALFVSEHALNAAGMHLDSVCETAPPIQSRVATAPTTTNAATNSGPSFASAACGSLRECKISVESDFQYYQRFNNLNAETVYTTTLWSFISNRYQTQINTVLTFPYVGFYTTSNDPWSTPDTPGTSGDMLNEFRNAWLGNIPNGGRLGHFMSGASLGGGVAWLNVLCNANYSFAVAGNMNGTISFPIVQQPNNWDFIVCAHELGHNFDALHTHDYCPPLDQCPPSQYWGSCQTAQVCTNQGTIMSYCHLCSGGTANITTFFHPTSVADMTAAAQGCLPVFQGILGTNPSTLTVGTPRAVSVWTVGTPVGSAQIHWRASPLGTFQTIAMQNVGNGTWSGSLPAFACGDTPQYYYSFVEQSCGTVNDPAGAPLAFYSSALAGTTQPVFQDNFETDLGWTPANLGATAGDWQRGVPVNDPNWAYDPATDGDGSGSCWLTQNAAGNTDVDNGAVSLTSPQLDMSGGIVELGYRYYLDLTVSNGDDRLRVDISSNGTAGPWVEIARHTGSTGTNWASYAIPASTITSAGVTLGNNMRVRFTANDGGVQSIVEAGLDAFTVSKSACNGIGLNYCTSSMNSTGAPAVISATGSSSIAANDLVLHAAPVPSATNGIFFFGANQMQAPFANGTRCVASPVVRFGIGVANGNQLDRAVNYALPPAVSYLTVGSTWNFQAWFRDSAAGGTFADLSDGLRITFQP